MGRPPCCCDESGTMKRGPWTPEEDDKLSDYISKHGTGNWRTVPKHSGLNRCGKSCRLRWTNYLRPDIKRGKFTEEEERLIINLRSVLGNKWSKIATHLPGRTDNEIKNFWNTILRKKLLQMGIEPETRQPRTDLKHLLNLSQLLGSMPNNNNNLMRHAGLQGLLQPDLTHQLAQIQLLQNLLQLMNDNSSFVNNMQSNFPLLGNHSFINNPIMEEDTNGLNSALTNNLREQELYASPTLFLDPALSDTHQDISESWANLEGALDQQAFDINSSHELNQAENPFLATGSANFNQMERFNIDEIIMSQSSAFDAWEKLLLEDDTSDDSYWKELLESPISW